MSYVLLSVLVALVALRNFQFPVQRRWTQSCINQYRILYKSTVSVTKSPDYDLIVGVVVAASLCLM